jgi:hypothetical protein
MSAFEPSSSRDRAVLFMTLSYVCAAALLIMLI